MLSILDTGIIIVYLISMIIMGYTLGKGNKTSNDYFLANRAMPWLPVGFSVAATMISANGFVGGPGWAYQDGIRPYMVNIGVPLAIFFVMLTSMPIIYHLRITSVYEYVEMRLGVRTRVLTVVGFLSNSIIQISSMVFIPALILRTFTGWKLEVIVPVIVLVAILYTLLGGIKAVIWTDLIQMLVLWGGLFVAIAIILNGLGLGFLETLQAGKEAGKLAAFDFSLNLSSANTFWATLIGGTFMWLRYFGFDQGQVQRMLTSKSMKGLKRSFLFSAVMMNVMYFTFMVLGVLLYVYFEGATFSNANEIMITFIHTKLPIGLIGLLIAGVFAAAMSSIDSLLNSMTTVFVKDIYERFFVKVERETTLKFSMTISLLWGICIILVTLFSFSGTTRSVLDTVGSYISYISGPMCGAFILAMATKRANDKGVTTGILFGFALTLIFGKTAGANWLWNPAVGAGATMLIGYLVSWMAKPEKGSVLTDRLTIFGMRQYLIQNNQSTEEGVSCLPLHMDRYSWLVLLFFVAQYVVLAALQY